MSGDNERRSEYKTLGKIEANIENIAEICRKTSEWMGKHDGQGPSTTHYQIDKRLSNHSKRINWMLGGVGLGAFFLSMLVGAKGWIKSVFGFGE